MNGLQDHLQSLRRLYAAGELDAALEACELALKSFPGSVDAWRLFAEISGQLGAKEQSVAGYRRCLELQPQDTEVLNAIGIALGQCGALSDAVRAFAQALNLSPTFAQGQHNLGVAFAQMNQLSAAERCLRLAVELKPDYAEGFLSLANTLASLGRFAESVIAYERSVELAPASADALNGLGLALIKAKQHPVAVVILRQATRMKPSFGGALNNLGLALCGEGKYDEAEAAFDAALRIDPKSADAHTNLGNLFKEQGKLDRALMSYDFAIALGPDNRSARWNRSLALLQKGDFENGWPEYESRWHRAGVLAPRQLVKPEWDGSPLEGKTILVHCEQGLGDAIQFIRYTSLLKQSAAYVVLEVPPPLVGIASTCPWIDRLLCEGDSLPHFDVHVPVMSLPWLFKTQLDSIPADIPYLFPAEDRVQYWNDRLKRLTGLKVGIAWQGNPHHQWDRHRSVPLTLFSSLSRIRSVHLISLQRGPGTEQLQSASFPIVKVLDQNSTDSECLMDTAAIMRSVDLVVTVDTATAHLAGAVGVKTWLLLSTLVDWRWFLERCTSPWYPTFTLFRQNARDEWNEPFRRMAQELEEMLG